MTHSNESSCKSCGQPIVQKGDGRGHRKREYCDDICRQRAHRVGKGAAVVGETNAHCDLCGVGDYDHKSRVRSKKQKVSRLVYDHDHDHETGVIRGMLCHRCNTALGWFKDDPTLLSKALDYLKNANTGRIYNGNASPIQKESDQQDIKAYQEKLTQAARRIEKLERQVETQRQKLDQYYQVPSRVAELEQEVGLIHTSVILGAR